MDSRPSDAAKLKEMRPSGGVLGGEAVNAPHNAWLQGQIEKTPKARAGLVVVYEEGGYRPTALWPAPAAVQPLVDLVGHVINSDNGLISKLPAPEDAATAPNHAIGYPVRADGRIIAVAAIALQAENEAALAQVMRDLKTGTETLRAMIVGPEASPIQEQIATDAGAALDVIAAIFTQRDAKSAALAFVTELARLFESDRVSIGFISRGRVKLMQMSHNPDFEPRMNISRLIEESMDEAVDQLCTLNICNGSSQGANTDVIHMAYDRLAEMAGHCAVITAPLMVGNEPVGAVMLERPPSKPFSHSETAIVESIAALAAPALDDKRRNDRWIGLKVVDAFGEGLARLIGPTYTLWKTVGIAALVAGLFVTLVKVDNRPSFEARVQGEVQQVVAAPFDGYIDAASVRAGDRVASGQELLALEDNDLQLDRLKWLGEAARVDSLYQEAVASRDRAQINVLRAQRDQAQAQLELVERQLRRTKIKAPFDGFVVSGDLSQRLGSAVSKGEELFVLAPLDRFRVDLLVRESRVSDLKEGQEGRLLLAAFPSDRFPIKIEKITPQTVSKDGATYFNVEASLLGETPALQPGMEGVGKISVGKASLLGIWTRDLREWLLLRFWPWT